MRKKLNEFLSPRKLEELGSPANVLFNIFLEFCRRNETVPILNGLVILLSRTAWGNIGKSKMRQLVSVLPPTNPLFTSLDRPGVAVSIPVHRKDVWKLPLVVEGIYKTCQNPIVTFDIWTAKENLNLPEVKELSKTVRVIDERELLNVEISHAIGSFPKKRQGWINQQILKIRSVLWNQCEFTLISDADTVQLESRTWCNSDTRQLLLVANEFHEPYLRHNIKFNNLSFPLSFVTHHQLMQKTVIERIFTDDTLGIVSWIRSASANEPSALSEYNTYGVWLCRSNLDSVKFAKWNNLEVNSKDFDKPYQELLKLYGKFASISCHN